MTALVLVGGGRHTRAGSEVRIYRAGTDEVLGTRLLDTGGGYCSQNVMPVHIGLPEGVEVVITYDRSELIRGAVSTPAVGIRSPHGPGQLFTRGKVDGTQSGSGVMKKPEPGQIDKTTW